MVRSCSPGAVLSLVFLLIVSFSDRSVRAQATGEGDLPHIVVLATGGTIASRADSPTQVSGYSIGFTGQDLLAMIPGVERVARVEVEQFSNISSALSADGPLNLFHSIRLAADSGAHGMGVLVMLNDEINSAREVYKSDTHRLQTFRSGELGLLGWVDSDAVVFYRRPLRRHTLETEFDVRGLSELPRVDIVYTYIGVDEYAVKGFIEAGTRGLVVEGIGAGGSPGSFRSAGRLLREAGVVVVSGSRTPDGRVSRGVDTLPAHKARILLMLALTRTSDPAEIRRIFSEY